MMLCLERNRLLKTLTQTHLYGIRTFIYRVFHFSAPCNNYSMITVKQLLFICKKFFRRNDLIFGNTSHSKLVLKSLNLVSYFPNNLGLMLLRGLVWLAPSKRTGTQLHVFLYIQTKPYMLTEIHWHPMSSNNQRNMVSLRVITTWCLANISTRPSWGIFLRMWLLHNAKHPCIAKSYLLKWRKVNTYCVWSKTVPQGNQSNNNQRQQWHFVLIEVLKTKKKLWHKVPIYKLYLFK